jgi:hypothetical protein
MLCELLAQTRVCSEPECSPIHFPDHFFIIIFAFSSPFRELSPMRPLDTSLSPVSPLFPIDTRKQGGTPLPAMTNRSIPGILLRVLCSRYGAWRSPNPCRRLHHMTGSLIKFGRRADIFDLPTELPHEKPLAAVACRGPWITIHKSRVTSYESRFPKSNHFHTLAQSCFREGYRPMAKSNYSHTYGPLSRKSNYSRTYANPPGGCTCRKAPAGLRRRQLLK